MIRFLSTRTVIMAALLTTLAAIPQPLRAQDQPPPAAPEQLVNLRKSWKAAAARDTQPLKDQYLRALLRLREELTRNERFDRAVLVRDEIEAQKQNTPLEQAGRVGKQEGPEELRKLRDTFDRELRKIESANNEKYARALRQLQRTCAREGKLDAAVAVRDELATLQRRIKAAELARTVTLPEDAVGWNDHHYKFISSPKISFAQAKAECDDLGGHLAILESEEERVFLHGLHNGGGAWIGGSDEEEEGEFLWLDGSPFAKSVTNYLGNDNTANRDFLYLQKSGAVSCRSNHGEEKKFPLKWVNGYLCEWDF